MILLDKITREIKANQSQRGRGGGRGNRRGRGNSNNWVNRNKPQCQICTKFGHTALKCFFRYAPSRNNSSPSGFPSSPFPQNSNYSNVSQMSAIVASPDLNIHSKWYLDSGPTNHLTNNFNNLSTGSEYEGGSQIFWFRFANFTLWFCFFSFLKQ